MFLGSFYPIGKSCFDFYKAGVIPNPGDDQCLNLLTINGTKISCCHNNIIPSKDNNSCPGYSLGVEKHCYTINKRNMTTLEAERHCQEKGGNLVQFGSRDEIDTLHDILFSHPHHSFRLTQIPLLTGVYTDPHLLFSSSSSGEIVRDITTDPRYTNASATELGSCSIIEHLVSFEKYSAIQSLATGGMVTSNTTKPWYWIPEHKFELGPWNCTNATWSICDHRKTTAFIAYDLSPSKLFNSTTLENVLGLYIHPMNSITACVSFCISQSQSSTIIIFGKTCLCTSGKHLFEVA